MSGRGTIQQRFANNVRDNINRGIGEHAFHVKGYKFPSHEQMDKFEKYDIPFDVDTALRELVIDLNRRGYRTLGSCQGHQEGWRGSISISPSKTEMIQLAKDLEVKDKKFTWKQIFEMMVKDFLPSSKEINTEEVKAVLKRYGMTRIKHERPTVYTGRGTVQLHHAFTFSPVIGR